MNITDSLDGFCATIKDEKTEKAYRIDLETFFIHYYLIKYEKVLSKKLTTIDKIRNFFKKNYYDREESEVVNEKKCKRYSAFLDKKFNFSEISINHLVAHINLYKNLKATTRNRKRSAFRKFFKYLLNEREVSESVTERHRDDFKSESEGRFIRRFPKEKELTLMLEVCKNLKEQAMVQVTFKVGIRANGLINLNVRDIDWDNEVMKVYGAKRRDKKHVSNYPFGKETGNLLKEYLNERTEGYVFNANTSDPDKKFNNPYSENGFLYIINSIGKRIGITDLTIHSGKWHFGNALQRSRKLTLKEIQLLMHHKDFKTTQRYLTADIDEASRKMREIEGF